MDPETLLVSQPVDRLAGAIVAHLNSDGARLQPGEHSGRRMDADETNMLALALEQMRTKVYEADYPELKARAMLSVASDIDTGAESFAYEETDEVGIAKVITNWAAPLPGVETSGRKLTQGIVSIGTGYTYSIQDMRRAAFAGRPLEARKAVAARRAFERKIDELAAIGGETTAGISKGVCNRTAGTGSGQVRSTAMTAAAWDSTPVAADMLADLQKLVSEFVTDGKELYEPKRLAMPLVHYMRALHTMFTDGRPESVLTRFLANNGFVKDVMPWNKLLGVAGTGISDATPNGGDESRFLLMSGDPDVAELVIPQEFEVFGPQPINLAFQVACHGRTAGCVIYRPLGLRYGTGLGVA
jgi:hypothetical protein